MLTEHTGSATVEDTAGQCEITPANSHSRQSFARPQETPKYAERHSCSSPTSVPMSNDCSSLFGTTQMKAKIDIAKQARATDLQTNQRGDDILSRFRNLCGRFINDRRVQIAIIFLIFANAVLLGIGTFDFVTDDEEVSQVFFKIDLIFLVVFTVEISLQLIYHGYKFFTDGWMCFDFVIVLLSWSLDNMSVFRAFRVMRSLRLVSRLKSLKNLMVALIQVGPSVMAVMALLVLIMYIFGVLCTELFRDLYELGYSDRNYFGTLPLSLFTLLQMVTLDWAKPVRAAQEMHGWSGILFSVFLVQTSFILYSLVIAIICDSVKVAEHLEEHEVELKEERDSRVRLAQMRSQVQELTRKQRVAMESVLKALDEIDKSTGANMVSTVLTETDSLSGSDDFSTTPTNYSPFSGVTPEENENRAIEVKQGQIIKGRIRSLSMPALPTFDEINEDELGGDVLHRPS